MVFENPIYMIYIDGFFRGIADTEDEAYEYANDYLCGQLLDDDMPDRVWLEKIDVNRWYKYNQYNCSDKLSNDNIFCHDNEATEECVKLMNKINIQQERKEAQLRASLL